MGFSIRRALKVQRSKRLGTEGVTLLLYEEDLPDNSKVYDVTVILPGTEELSRDDLLNRSPRMDKVLECQAVNLEDANKKYAWIEGLMERLGEALKSFEEV